MVYSIKNLDELKKNLLSSNLNRFVIKPSDGRGARGVLLIDKNTELEWAFSEAKKYGSTGKIILEEFVNGLQLSTESFLINGKVFTPAISERNYEFLERFFPYFIENGGTIPANLTSNMKNKIDKLISDGAMALGVKEGIVKGDIVIKSDGTPMIIELALRLSGGWLSSHQIPANWSKFSRYCYISRFRKKNFCSITFTKKNNGYSNSLLVSKTRKN